MTLRPSPIKPLALVVWGLAALFFLYEFFLRTFVGSLAHQIIPDLQLTPETFALLASAYYVAYGIMQIPVGMLADKFGVKWNIVFATLLCAAATLLFAHANNLLTALLSRSLMGLGSSFAFVCLLVIAVTWFPTKYFGFFSGISQLIGTMGPLLAGGPFIEFMLKTHENWRIAITQVASFGFLLALGMCLFIKNKPRDTQNPLIFLTVNEPISKCLGYLLRNKQVWYIALYSACTYFSIALLGAIWGTAYLETRGLSQALSADFISLAWLGYAIACPVLGTLSDIAKRRRPTLITCAILGLISTTCIVYAPLNNFPWCYGFLFLLLGIGASGQNIGFVTISEHASNNVRATAIGLNNAAITFFSAIFPPVSSYFIEINSKQHANQFVSQDFYGGFSVMPLFFFIAILITCYGITETFCKPQRELILLKR